MRKHIYNWGTNKKQDLQIQSFLNMTESKKCWKRKFIYCDCVTIMQECDSDVFVERMF